MAHILLTIGVLLAVFCGLISTDRHSGVRNHRADCEQRSFVKKIIRLCDSYFDHKGKSVRQTGGYNRLHHHRRRYGNNKHHHRAFDAHNSVNQETKSSEQIDTPPTTTISSNGNHSVFEESLLIWYLNPVGMGSNENSIGNEGKPKTTDPEEDDPSSLSSEMRGNGIETERWRRHPSKWQKVQQFFNETCCKIGCAFPADFAKLWDHVC